MHYDGIKIMSDASLKSAKEATCSNNTYICEVFLRSSLGGMKRIKGERGELQSDRANKHDQHRVNLGRFAVEKGRLSLKMLHVDIQNWASCWGWEHIFIKIVKKVA